MHCVFYVSTCIHAPWPLSSQKRSGHTAWLALALLCSLQLQRGLPIRTGDDAVPGFGAAAYRQEGPPPDTPEPPSPPPPAATAAVAALLLAWGRVLCRDACALAHASTVRRLVVQVVWVLQLASWAAVVVDTLPEGGGADWWAPEWWAPYLPARVCECMCRIPKCAIYQVAWTRTPVCSTQNLLFFTQSIVQL